MKRSNKISGLLGAMVLAMALTGCGSKESVEKTEATAEVTTIQDSQTSEISTEQTTEETVVEMAIPEDGSVRIRGEYYKFSTENGIDNWENVAGGYVIFGGADNDFYPLNREGSISVEYNDYENYPVVFRRGQVVDINGTMLGKSSFQIYRDYMLSDGVTAAVTAEELLSMGYRKANPSEDYDIYYTDKGYLNYDDIRADYEKMVDEDSFKVLDYVDYLPKVGADGVKAAVYMDDVAEAIEYMERFNDGDLANAMIGWLAEAKCTKMLVEGEIDYYINQFISIESDGETNATLIFTVKEDSMSQWMKNWGVLKQD